MKKKEKAKSLGSFTILKEKREEYVKMDVDMSDSFRSFLLKEGKKAAKENEEFYVNLGFNAFLRKYLEKKPLKDKKS